MLKTQNILIYYSDILHSELIIALISFNRLEHGKFQIKNTDSYQVC